MHSEPPLRVVVDVLLGFFLFYRGFSDDEHGLLAGERDVRVGLHERLDAGQREFGDPAVGHCCGGRGACLLRAALLLRLGPAALLLAPAPVGVVLRGGDGHRCCHFHTNVIFHTKNHERFLATCHT